MQDQKDKKIYDRLRLAIEKAGVRGTDIARQLGVSPTAVSRWLLGKREIKVELLHDFYRLYGINPYYIITGEGPPVLSQDEAGRISALYAQKKTSLKKTRNC